MIYNPAFVVPVPCVAIIICSLQGGENAISRSKCNRVDNDVLHYTGNSDQSWLVLKIKHPRFFYGIMTDLDLSLCLPFGEANRSLL